MLKQRILTVLVLLAVFVPAALFLPDWGWGILISAVVGIAAWEWAGLAQLDKRTCRNYGLGLFVCLAALAVGTANANAKEFLTPVVIPCILFAPLFWFVGVPLWLHYRWSLKGIRGLAVGLLVLVPPWLMCVSFSDNAGVVGPRGWILLSIPIAWVADIGAYCVDRMFGRHKLALSLNPGKTWEGVAGAFVVVFCYLFLPLGTLLLMGDEIVLAVIFKFLCAAAVCTAACVLGNLFVSLLKRQANVEYSSTLLPGHGGVLDLIDSMLALLAIWAIALFIVLFGLTA